MPYRYHLGLLYRLYRHSLGILHTTSSEAGRVKYLRKREQEMLQADWLVNEGIRALCEVPDSSAAETGLLTTETAYYRARARLVFCNAAVESTKLALHGRLACQSPSQYHLARKSRWRLWPTGLPSSSSPTPLWRGVNLPVSRFSLQCTQHTMTVPARECEITA